MKSDQFSAEESRKLAVLIARAWADPHLAAEYKRSPEAVLSGAGISLSGRTTPELPDRPAELAARAELRAEASSASSLSTITCPCTGCTASCANCIASEADFRPDSAALLKLADSEESRAQARKLAAAWGLNVSVSK